MLDRLILKGAAWGNIVLLKGMYQRAVRMRTDCLWIRLNSLDILGDTVIAGLQRYSEKWAGQSAMDVLNGFGGERG